MADIRGIVDFTPGFSGKTEDGFTDALAMRGIATNDFGIGGDPSVAMFVDGIWSGRTGGVMTSMYDVERAEVVKGPQGTLFGRNSIAGAVSVITDKPDSVFGANAELTLADFDHVEAQAMVNIPLNDQWAVRAAGYVLDNKGFLENLAGGDDLGFHQVSAGRVSLRRTGDSFDATLIAAFEDREQDPSVYWVPGRRPRRGRGEHRPRRRRHRRIGRSRRRAPSWSGRSPAAIALTSLTGFKKFSFHYLEDYDGGPDQVNDYGQINDVEYWSQELRLNSPGDGKVTWFAGASIYQEEIDGRFDYIYDEDALCRAAQHHRGTGLRRPGGGLRRPELRGLLGGRHRSRRHPRGQDRAQLRGRGEQGLGGLRRLHLGRSATAWS